MPQNTSIATLAGNDSGVPSSRETAVVDPSRDGDQHVKSAEQRVREWLSGLQPNTRRAYTRDLGAFVAYLGEVSLGAALERLCGVRRARALELVEGWRDTMRAPTADMPDGLSAATINRCLAAINSTLRHLGKADVGPGRLDVALIKAESRRDTAGPAAPDIGGVLRRMESESVPASVRNTAIVALAARRGLRRAEIANLRMVDIDLGRSQIAVLRKGKRERVRITVSGSTIEALNAWLAIRPEHANPDCAAVFVTLARGTRGTPMTTGGIYDIVRAAGASIGQTWRPHGLRHTAATTVLNNGGSLVAAQEFLGHANIATTTRYNDEKRRAADLAVQIVADKI